MSVIMRGTEVCEERGVSKWYALSNNITTFRNLVKRDQRIEGGKARKKKRRRVDYK